MQSWKSPMASLLMLLLPTLMACRKGEEERTEVADPVVEEIPITTASGGALADFEQGQRLMDVGRLQESRAHFESAVAQDAGFAYAYLNLNKTAQSAREFSDNLQQAVAHVAGKSDGERLLIEIQRTTFDNNATARIELARELVEKYPHSPRAWLELGRIQGEQNQHRAARESLRQAQELDPKLAATHFATWASFLFNEPKDFARAEAAMQASLEIVPDEARIHENLGDVYRAMDRLEDARQAYTRAIKVDPDLSSASIKKGHINSFLGRFEEARADYDAGLAVANDRDRIAFANYRAFVHLHAGDPQAALAELDGLSEAARTSGLPDDQILGLEIFTLTNQATIALHHRLADDAREILARRTAVMRANAETVGDADFTRQQEANILLWEAQLAARLGDAETARTKAEEHRALVAEDRNPRRFEGYHGVLGLVDLLGGAYGEAVAQLEKSNLNEMYTKYHLALAKEGAGEIEAARALFREVAEWNFNSVGFALVRQDALAKL